MEIKMEKDLDKLVIALSGRLDTTTAPELEEKFKTELSDVTELVVDLADLEYISSAGVREVVAAYKKMDGALVVKNVSSGIMSIFKATGIDKKVRFENA